jgi:hypothetical protein
MTEPRRPRNLDVTVLDEGRVRLFPATISAYDAALAETVLDEGRHRPATLPLAPCRCGDGAAAEASAEASAAAAAAAPVEAPAARYELIRQLDLPATQADLFLVRDRHTGDEVVLKRYHHGHRPHPDVRSYLSTEPDHVVRYREFEAGYEVMDYLPGGTLREWRRAHPTGFNVDTMQVIAQQVAAVLVSLHRQGLVHRDIKPANILVRSTDQIDLAVIDFGIACPVDEPHPVAQPNPAYQPPEAVLLGRVGKAGDWWALGMTLLELAAGEHPFEDLAPVDIKGHFGRQRPVNVSGIPDEPRSSSGGRRDRLRSLCLGLLASDPAQRWGEREVSDWLVGQDPPLPAQWNAGPDEAARREVSGPYLFNGVRHHHREDLALALATAWNHAVEAVVARDGNLAELHTWLDQFTDDDGAEAGRVVDEARQQPHESGHVRLLRIVRALAPTVAATYRNHPISRQHLQTLARQALTNDGDAASVLDDLWTHRLLPGFDAAAPAESSPTDGGQALVELDRQWQIEAGRWGAAVERVTDPAPRQYLAESVRATDVLAVCLLAALRQSRDVSEARELVRQTARSVADDVPWFSTLAREPDLMWLAWMLCGYATSRAQTLADQRETKRLRDQEWRAGVLFRHWLDRQNRPAALGWAVAGVCLMVVGWIALITGSDAVGWATGSAIGLAWIGAAVCAAVSLTVECLFAAEVGGRFHPRHSIPGAGVLALRPLARWMRRAWLPAGGTALAALAGIAAVALLVPQLIAALTTVAHLLWVGHRWRAWQRQVGEENDLIAQAESRGPSDTGVPVGAREGAGT